MKAHIQVVLGTFNRPEKTRQCMQALATAQGVREGDVRMQITAVDASTDDRTENVIKGYFPDARVLSVSSDVFWAASMRRGIQEIEHHAADFVLLLNDDVGIYSNALVDAVRLAAGNKARGDAEGPIIVGQTEQDQGTGEITYGGRYFKKRLHKLDFPLAYAASEAIEVDTFNANFVLIPKPTLTKVGNLDAAFSHAMADLDLGLRARAAGIRNVVMPGFIGVCADHRGEPKKTKRWRERLRSLSNAKNPPLNEYARFCARHGGYRVVPEIGNLVVRTLSPW